MSWSQMFLLVVVNKVVFRASLVNTLFVFNLIENQNLEVLFMSLSSIMLDYFNRKKSKSTDKNHSRFRNDICNHWDLDYLSLDELEEQLKRDVDTTIVRKKNEN